MTKRVCKLLSKIDEQVEPDIGFIFFKGFPLGLHQSIKSQIRGQVYSELVSDRLNFFTERNPLAQVIYNPKGNMDILPNWTMFHRTSGKYINGFNFLDIWSGGYQTNVARMLIHRPDPNDLLVIGLHPKTLRKGTLKYDLIDEGMRKGKIVFTGGLNNHLLEKLF